MPKFSVGDRVVYVGGGKKVRPENVGLTGTVIGPVREDGMQHVQFDPPSPWLAFDGRFFSYPENLQKLTDTDADTLARD